MKAASASRKSGRVQPKKVGHVKIDSDGHVYEPADLWQRYMPAKLRERGPKMFASDMMLSSTLVMDGVRIPPIEVPRTMWSDERKARYKGPKASNYSVQAQLDGMDAEGVDASVLFPTRGLLVMGAAGVDPVVTTAAAGAYNQWLSDFCADGKKRLFGAGMIDPRDIAGARREVRRCARDFRFPAAFLRPNPVNSLPWHSPAYDALWSELEDTDTALCFHEGAMVLLPQVGVDRFSEHAFYHACNHPMEQQMAMLSMLLGGVAERHPKLRMAFLECGAGWLPYWLWRLDEHVEGEQHRFPHLKMLPSEYARRQCFVSIDSDEHTGFSAMELTKEPRVVWGSDFPHPDGKFPHALQTLVSLPGMNAEKFQKVVSDAPRALFGERLTLARRGSAVASA